MLFVLLCVLAAQVHASVDLDSCLLNGSGHNGASHSHRCHGCESGTLVLAGGLPNLSPFAYFLRLDGDGHQPFATRLNFQHRAPRAPPV